MADQRAVDLAGGRLDEHGIEPIPVQDQTSTPWRQFWIWAGANLAPINWVLGALGIILGLSLVETLLVLVIGNLVGCALFGLFCIMGHRTGVNQMVLSRAAFGRRGATCPRRSGVPDDDGLARREHVDRARPRARSSRRWASRTPARHEVRRWDRDHGRAGVIAIVGFYGSRRSRWTVPIAAGIMVLIPILAWSKVDINWTTSTVSGSDKLASVPAADDRHRHRLGNHMAVVVV